MGARHADGAHARDVFARGVELRRARNSVGCGLVGDCRDFDGRAGGAGGGAASGGMAGQRPTASFGAVAHALDVLPIASAGVFEWFTFDYQQLRSFPADASVALSVPPSSTAAAAPRLAAAVESLGALFAAANGAARLAFNGSVGAGDRVAVVPAATPCASVVDPGAVTGADVFATDLSVVSLDAAVSALVRVPPTSGGNARALCVAMSAAAWNLTLPAVGAPFVAVLAGAGAVAVTFAAEAGTPPPPPSAQNSAAIVIAVVCVGVTACACAAGALLYFSRRRRRARAAHAKGVVAVAVQSVENPVRQRRFRKVVDADDGAVFFECAATGETSWTLPQGAEVVGGRSFRRIVDDGDGAVFYEDCETGDAVWALPEGASVEDGGGEPESRRRFRRAVDDADGAVFFVDCESGETVWTVPSGGEVLGGGGEEQRC